MTYESTVTSKGTITLPSSIRSKLGITEGKKVSITLKGDTIKVRSQSGWEEVFAVAAKISSGMRKNNKRLPATDEELKRLVDDTKARQYREKYVKEA